MTARRSILSLVVLGAACGSGPDISVPPLTPIVRDATPAALALPQMATRSLMRRLVDALEGQAYAGDAPDAATIEGALRVVFQGTGVASEPPTKGFVIGWIEDVDHRKAEFDDQAKGDKGSCLDRPAATLSVASLSASLPAPVARFTLNDMKCRSHFAGDSAAGMVFGANVVNDVVTDYSIWESPHKKGSGERFGYLVNVDGPESSDPRVDFLYVENSPSYDNRVMMARMKARPTTLDAASGIRVKSFQITMAASAGGVPGLSCGFRMISDGSLIWAEGRHFATGSDCATATTFARCYSASDMTARAASDCDKMKTFDPEITLVDGPSLAAQGAAFTEVLDLGHSTGSVADL